MASALAPSFKEQTILCAHGIIWDLVPLGPRGVESYAVPNAAASALAIYFSCHVHFVLKFSVRIYKPGTHSTRSGAKTIKRTTPPGGAEGAACFVLSQVNCPDTDCERLPRVSSTDFSSVRPPETLPGTWRARKAGGAITELQTAVSRITRRANHKRGWQLLSRSLQKISGPQKRLKYIRFLKSRNCSPLSGWKVFALPSHVEDAKQAPTPPPPP